MIITLDGPAGSGKSTLAQLLAIKLGYFYSNSGYLYRSLAYILVHEFGYDEKLLAAPLVDHVDLILTSDNFVYHYQGGAARVIYKGNDITHHLKASLISHYASIVSAHQDVRHAVAKLQRHFGTMYDLVTDGRDCGTEIYPHADFKFYITATPEIRAQRMLADCIKKNQCMNFDDALRLTLQRDARDMQRMISPLKKADDAIEIDTSDRSIQELVDLMLAIILNS